ncbi:hypothetical protein [Cyanobium sp. Morenito 9A2]|uniref:hypothetical protein n=1 Tax=Cyanobium sp. Morenito 9A2 TaxID=2823718 RepID=UPI0020CEA99C|nr:hypothetical protein [Cyanobium sp. Morenito 9A2]MCP9850051.1 hypothetical protein [Cyanobium sp. Morenito 9A2]
MAVCPAALDPPERRQWEASTARDDQGPGLFLNVGPVLLLADSLGRLTGPGGAPWVNPGLALALWDSLPVALHNLDVAG